MAVPYNEFAAKIKAKYPEYKDVDDLTLSQKMVEKFPEYKNQVTFDMGGSGVVQKNQQPVDVSLAPEAGIGMQMNSTPSGTALNTNEANQVIYGQMPGTTKVGDETFAPIGGGYQNTKGKSSVQVMPEPEQVQMHGVNAKAPKLEMQTIVDNPDEQTQQSTGNGFIDSMMNGFGELVNMTGYAIVNQLDESLTDPQKESWAYKNVFSKLHSDLKDYYLNNVKNPRWKAPEKESVGSFIGSMIPYGAMAGLTIAQPELAPVMTSAFFESGYGQGLMQAEGTDLSDDEKAGIGALYGALYTLPIFDKITKVIPKSVLSKAITKSLIDNPESKVLAKDIIENYARKNPSLAKQLLNSTAHSVGTMEIMGIGQLAVNDFLLGQNINAKDYLNTAGESLISGIAFGVMTGPFAVYAQNATTKARRMNSGEVTIAYDKTSGQPVEIIPTETGMIGLKPNGSKVEVTPDMVENSITMTSTDFYNAIDTFNKTKQVSETIDRDVYSGRLMQALNRLSVDGNVFVPKVNQDGTAQIRRGENTNILPFYSKDAEGNLIGIDKEGKIYKLGNDIPVDEVDAMDVHSSLMAKYDEARKPSEKEQVSVQLEDKTNQETGTIQTLKLKSGETVQTTSGIVKFDESGKFDKNNSSELIYYKDANGNVQILNPNHIESLVEEVPVEVAQEQAVNIIDEQRISAEIDEFYPKEPEYYADGNGNELMIYSDESGLKVVEIDENGNAINEPYGLSDEQYAEISGKQLPESIKTSENMPVNEGMSPVVSNDMTENAPLATAEQQNTEEVQKPVIPSDEKGNMIFEQAAPEDTVNFLYDNFDTPEEVNSVVDSRIADLNKQISKIATFKPSGNIQKDIQNKQAQKAQLQQLNEQLGYWNGIKQSLTPKAPEVKPVVQPVESVVKRKPENKAGAKREGEWGEVKGLRDLVIRLFANRGQRVRWNDLKSDNGSVISRGLGGEYRYSEPERKSHLGVTANYAPTPEQLAHAIWQDNAFEQGQFVDFPLYGTDTQQILDEVLDVLNTYTKGEMIQAGYDMNITPEEVAQVEQAVEEVFNNSVNEIDNFINNPEENPFFVDERELTPEEHGLEQYFNSLDSQSASGNKTTHGIASKENEGTNQISDVKESDKQTGLESSVDNGGTIGSSEGVNGLTQAELDTQELDAYIAGQEHKTNPTDKQKETGVYPKARISLQGHNITIETLKGTNRTGTDSNGKKWSVTMNNHYGELDGTIGYDGDAIDVFVGPNPKRGEIFVIDQVSNDGTFDESKVMLGFDTAEQAKAAYMSNYEEGWQGFGNITPAGENFKQWLYDGKKQRKPYAEYKETPEAVELIEQTLEEIGKPTEPTQKEPWEMTRGEYINDIFNTEKWNDVEQNTFEYKSATKHLKEGQKPDAVQQEWFKEAINKTSDYFKKEHKKAIQQALSEGKQVPENVLADYPDLKPEVKPEVKNEPKQEIKTPKTETIEPKAESLSEEQVIMTKEARKSPTSVRELADMDAEDNNGYLSAGVLTTVEQGQIFKVGQRTYTVTRKTKPNKATYENDKYKGEYTRVSVTITDDKGKKYSFEIWDDWTQNGKRMVSTIARTGVTRKSDAVSGLSRDIEGDIMVDLINEYNQFHEKSDSYKILNKYIIDVNRKLETSPKQTTSQTENSEKLSEIPSEQPVKEEVAKTENAESFQKSEPTTKQSEQIRKLLDEKAQIKAKKDKLVKELADRNGLFGDTKSNPNDLFGGEGAVDVNAASDKLGEYNDRMSEIDRQVAELKKNEATGLKEAEGQIEIKDTPEQRFDNSTDPDERLKAGTEIIRELEQILRVGSTPAKLYDTTEKFLSKYKEIVSDEDYQEAVKFVASGQRISGVRINEKVLINVEHNTKTTDLIGTYMHETGHKAFDLVFLGENLDNVEIYGIESFIPDVYWGESNRTKISEAVAHQIEELLNNYTPEQIKNGDVDVSLLDERIIYPLTKTLNKLSNGKISIIGTWKVNDIGSTAGSSGGIQENGDNRNDSNAEIESNQSDNGISEREAKKRELAERLKNKLKPDYKRYEIPKNFKDNIGVRRDISGKVSIIENFPDSQSMYQWEEEQLPEWTKETNKLVDKVRNGQYLDSEELKNILTTLSTAINHRYQKWEQENIENAYAILVHEGLIKPSQQYRIDEYTEIYNDLRRQNKPQFKRFDPELNAIAMELSEMIFEDGDVSFEDYSAQMLEYIGEPIRPLLKPYYEMARVTLEAPNMTSADEVHKYDITNFNHKQYVSNRSGRSQQDSPRTNEVPGNAAVIPSNGGTSGQMGTGKPKGDSRTIGRGRGKGDNDIQPSLFGEQSDIEVSEANKELSAKKPTTGDTDGRGNGIDSTEGHTDINGGPDAAGNKTDTGVSETFKQRVARKLIEQQKAESIPVKSMDIDNIRETLPFLLSEQQDDVLKAETRFYGEQHQNEKAAYGKGMLFTNGTGTGKTYTGLGIAKRFAKQGKGNILIVVPSEAKVLDWAKDGKNLGLEISPLKDTKDAGQGAVVTTYANFRANEALKNRDFDLVMYDESHRLMEEKTGKTSSTTNAHYAHSNVTEWQAFNRIQSVNPAYIQLREMGEARQWKGEPSQKEKDLQEKYNTEIKPVLQERAKKAYENTKVVFLSATPFKAHFNLRYANGSLFDWGNETTYASASRGMSRVDAESQFFLDNFGSAYEWKFHRLQAKQKSNAEAVAMQEVQFAENLIANGAMSGRAIESDKDYSREFPLVTLDNAETFNRALNEIYSDEFKALKDAANNVFHDYNYTTKLFESLKASMSIQRIQDHLDLGRKVVIFHRRKQADVLPPFRSVLEMARLEAQQTAYEVQNMDDGQKKDELVAKIDLIYQHINAFEAKYADLLAWEQTLDYSPAIDQLKRAFGEKVVFINGDTSKKDKPANINKFNDDNSEVKIIVVQEEAGKEGISLHDTTGKHQRVLMSLSLPISSTTTLQIEGRVYRIGQESNVPFEYPLLGIDQEISDFGQKINKKLSTTENLAMGNQARDLLRSFAEGVLFNSGTEKPNANQGVGGKEYDKKTQNELSEFRKAVLVYQSNQKVRGRRDSREGKDYYATPEPVGQKMVEFLGLQAGESAMEPSAGHGAIAMWFPDKVNATVIEPSYSLYTKLNARAGGGNRKMVNDIFENYNIINKYHGIAMNPPFGSGGKTAVDHVEKAFGHLYNNGRIVAIIPQGQADKRLDDFLERTPNAHLIASVKLPSSTFEQAGTSVNTRIVVIDRIDLPSRSELKTQVLRDAVSKGKYDEVYSNLDNEIAKKISEIRSELPQTENIDLSSAKTVDELFNEIEDLTVADRQGVVAETESETTEPVKQNFEQFTQKHGKTGEDMFMVAPTEFFERDVYNKLVAIAKENNGYYSSYSNKVQGVRAGFTFKTQEDADNFTLEANKGISKPEFKRIAPETGFYSTVENALDKLTQEKGTKEQFKAMLLKNGAKQAEMDWMGFDELPEKLTKSDIQNWIDENRIEVKEVTKADKTSYNWKQDGDIYKLGAFEITPVENQWSVYEEREGGHGFFNTIEEAKDFVERNIPNMDAPKFSQYVLPGGKNYKELLLTLSPKSNTDIKRLKYFDNKGFYNLTPEEQNEAVQLERKLRGTKDFNLLRGVESFNSSHFDEPNILAHVRFNERTVNVGRVLFIEEFQADKGQEWQKLKKLIEEGKATKADIDRFEFLDKNFPFNKTNEWLPLVARRMMRYAAENGFDRIAWTNGEQQAERYDLSKKIEKVEYWKVEREDLKEPRYGIYVYGKQGSRIYSTNKSLATPSELEDIIGKELTQKIVDNATTDVNEFTGLDLKVGGEGMKAFYDAIVPSAMSKLGKPFGAKVENIDLGFDSTDKNPLKLKGRRYNPPYGQGVMDITRLPGYDYIEKGDYIILDESANPIAFVKEQDAKSEQDAVELWYNVLEGDGEYKRVNSGAEVQSIPVTDEMKLSVMEGIPMFKRSQPTVPTFEPGESFADKAKKIREYEVEMNKWQKRNLEKLAAGEANDIEKLNKSVNNVKAKLWEGWADSQKPVKKWQEYLKKQGINIPDNDNYYLRFTATESRIEYRYAEYEKNIVDPFAELLRRFKSIRLKYEVVATYCKLKHADEYTKHIAKQKKVAVTPETDFAGKKAIEQRIGMSAEEYISEFEDMAGSLVPELWEKLKKLSHFSLNEEVRSGRRTVESADAIKKTFNYYVPLKGHADPTAETAWDYSMEHGDYFFSAVKHGKGRMSESADPFSVIISTARSSISASEDNILKQTLLRTAERDTTGSTSVSKTWFIKVGENEDGTTIWEIAPEIRYESTDTQESYNAKVEAEEKRMIALREAGEAYQGKIPKLDTGVWIKPVNTHEHDVTVMRNGETYTIRFNTAPRIPQAINKVNFRYYEGVMGKIFEAAGKTTRFLAAAKTMWRPTFIFITNPLRDIHAGLNLAFIDEGAAFTYNVAKYLPVAAYTLGKRATGNIDLNNKYDKMLNNYLLNGGKTGISKILELKQVEANLKDKVNGTVHPLRGVQKLYQTMSEITENQVRLAVYFAAIEKGYSTLKATSMAKEATVNFDRGGNGRNGLREMKSLYAFVNVAYQAIDNIWTKSTQSKESKRRAVATIMLNMAAGAFLTSIISSLICSLFGKDEDEWVEDFSKLSSFERNANFLVWTPNGVLKYPLGQEFRVYYGLGMDFMMWSKGKQTGAETALNFMKGMSSLLPYNPIESAAHGGLGSAFPDAVAPLTEIYLSNRDWLGSRIYKENQDEDAPGFMKVRTNKKGEPYAPSSLISASEYLNTITGGDNAVKGWISPNPDIINHLFEGYFAGLYQQPLTVVEAVVNKDPKEFIPKALWRGKEDIKTRNTGLNEKYYEFKDEIEETERQIKVYNSSNEQLTQDLKEGTIDKLSYDRMVKKNNDKINKLKTDEFYQGYGKVRVIDDMETELKEVSSKKQPDVERSINSLKENAVTGMSTGSYDEKLAEYKSKVKQVSDYKKAVILGGEKNQELEELSNKMYFSKGKVKSINSLIENLQKDMEKNPDKAEKNQKIIINLINKLP